MAAASAANSTVIDRQPIMFTPSAKLSDDEKRAKDVRIETLGWPRSSSFGRGFGICLYLSCKC